MADPSRVHGGATARDEAVAGVARGALLDFSANINPYGPSPAMRRTLQSVCIDRYPDPFADEARDAIGARLGVPRSDLALGNGASELLWSLARACLAPGRRVLVVGPTFSEFPAAAAATGADLRVWTAPAPQFTIDLDAVGACMAGVDAVYLCAPNSPTGQSVAASAIASWAARHPAATVIVDQSFLSLSSQWSDAAVAMPTNVVRVRSLTKDHAIPGVRVGYALAAAETIARLDANRPAWTVNAYALAAVGCAVEEDSFVAVSRAQLLRDRDWLGAELTARGLSCAESMTSFLLVHVGSAATTRERLLRDHRLLVRDCTSFGLPEHIRVSARPRTEAARLVAALSEAR